MGCVLPVDAPRNYNETSQDVIENVENIQTHEASTLGSSENEISEVETSNSSQKVPIYQISLHKTRKLSISISKILKTNKQSNKSATSISLCHVRASVTSPGSQIKEQLQEQESSHTGSTTTATSPAVTSETSQQSTEPSIKNEDSSSYEPHRFESITELTNIVAPLSNPFYHSDDDDDDGSEYHNYSVRRSSSRSTLQSVLSKKKHIKAILPNVSGDQVKLMQLHSNNLSHISSYDRYSNHSNYSMKAYKSSSGVDTESYMTKSTDGAPPELAIQFQNDYYYYQQTYLNHIYDHQLQDIEAVDQYYSDSSHSTHI